MLLHFVAVALIVFFPRMGNCVGTFKMWWCVFYLYMHFSGMKHFHRFVLGLGHPRSLRKVFAPCLDTESQAGSCCVVSAGPLGEVCDNSLLSQGRQLPLQPVRQPASLNLLTSKNLSICSIFTCVCVFKIQIKAMGDLDNMKRSCLCICMCMFILMIFLTAEAIESRL